jgi:RNA binding exosome subunit
MSKKNISFLLKMLMTLNQYQLSKSLKVLLEILEKHLIQSLHGYIKIINHENQKLNLFIKLSKQKLYQIKHVLFGIGVNLKQQLLYQILEI